MSISEKQLEANCRNALKSTGPRTAAGLAVSSKNALKHGLLSSEARLNEVCTRLLQNFTASWVSQ